MASVFLSPKADEQIFQTLAYTLKKFGDKQQQNYDRLIEAALEDLRHNPLVGKRQPSIHPEAWTYHIGRRGRSARHLFLYRIVRDDVEVAGFLYDGMDLPRHLPEDWQKTK